MSFYLNDLALVISRFSGSVILTCIIQAAVKELGGLDQVVLNHAYIPKARIFEKTQESYDIFKKVI